VDEVRVRISLFIMVWMFTVPVIAGHYDLGTVKFPFPIPVRQLQKLNIKTTLDLWRATRSFKQQKRLSTRLKLPLARVKRFHDFCDLLRVRGIGTKMAWVMQAAGIRNAAE